jgi:hypothetical protein
MGRRRRATLHHLVLPNADLAYRAKTATVDLPWVEGATWVEAREWLGFQLPLSLFSVFGVSMWFTDAATAVAVAAVEILAWASINDSPGAAYFSRLRGLAVYDPSPTGGAEIRIRRYFRL